MLLYNYTKLAEKRNHYVENIFLICFFSSVLKRFVQTMIKKKAMVGTFTVFQLIFKDMHKLISIR